MRVRHVAAFAAVSALFVGGPVLTATAHEQDWYDQDDAHDSRKMRQEAEEKVHWRDPNLPKTANPKSWRHIKLLGFNDFHGALERRTVAGRPAGGADVLASYLRAAQDAAEDGAIIVHAGDFVGASPPVSALLQDEPSISFLNMLANDACTYSNKMDPDCDTVGTLGNHEFDDGKTELLRLLNGGNHANGPFLESPWRGTRVPYVSANVVNGNTGKPLLPPYVIKKVKGAQIGFIGAVLKETPTIVTPAGVAGLTFLDEAQAINTYVQELKRRKVHAIVVTIHQGQPQTAYEGPTQPGTAPASGAIVDIVKQLDSDVDVVVSGHSHTFANMLVTNNQGKEILVTQAFSSGTAYDDIDIAIDPASKDIVEKSARVVTTWADQGPGLTPVAEVAALTAEAAATVAPIVSTIQGVAATDITRTENPAGESTLGNLIADAQRAAMGTEIAFMNPGGIRTDIFAGEVTWGELFAVQPFGNDTVQMTLTGSQILQVLEQQWLGQPFARILKPSGIRYTWDMNQAPGNRIVPGSVTVGGNPLNPVATYTVTVNSFLATGGDGFTAFNQGNNRVVGPVDLQALVDYIAALPQPFSAAIEGRINRIN